jgi:hypothetical protein
VLEGEDFSVDLLGGVRGVWTDTKLTFTFAAGGTSSGDRDESWIDPIIGVRGLWDLDDRWSVTGYGDAGAGASDYTFQLYGALNVQMTELLRLSGGYRYYDVKYENDGFLYDIVQDGILLGASFDF